MNSFFKITLISLGIGKANLHKSFAFGSYSGFFLPIIAPLGWGFECHRPKFALRGKYVLSSFSVLWWKYFIEDFYNSDDILLPLFTTEMLAFYWQTSNLGNIAYLCTFSGTYVLHLLSYGLLSIKVLCLPVTLPIMKTLISLKKKVFHRVGW